MPNVSIRDAKASCREYKDLIISHLSLKLPKTCSFHRCKTRKHFRQNSMTAHTDSGISSSFTAKYNQNSVCPSALHGGVTAGPTAIMTWPRAMARKGGSKSGNHIDGSCSVGGPGRRAVIARKSSLTSRLELGLCFSD